MGRQCALHYERKKDPGSDFKRMSFNPEGAGCVMANMLKEAGVIALYGTSFVDAVVTEGPGNNSITAIIVENASGRQAIAGKIFIEGSGTSEARGPIGAPFVSGGGGQPATAEWDGVNDPIPAGCFGLWMASTFKRSASIRTSPRIPLSKN